MKKILSLSLIAIMLCASLPSYARDIHARLSLVALKSLATTEPSHDQLYVDIAGYYPGGGFKYMRRPEHPSYWHVKKGETVPSQILWSEKLGDGESVELLVSLVEQDISVFNPDDLIGNAEIVIKNEGGKLSVQWKIPNTDKIPEKVTTERGLTLHRYTMTGDGGHYIMDLNVSF